MAATDTEAVRAAATEILNLDHEGHLDDALGRSRDLMLAHPTSPIAHRVLADLQYAAAIRIAGGEGSEEERRASSAPHLRVARDALVRARHLVPNCVDIAAALGDALAASRMFREAEAEFVRALRIADPVDPAVHNAAFGMYEGYEHERDPAFAAERVEEARGRARASYNRMTVDELIPMAVRRVLRVREESGAAEARKQAKRVAERFPGLARAQCLHAYMDLEFVRSLDPAIDKRPFLRRTLAIADRAAQAFPKSPVLAAFHSKLLFVLGEYNAAERECRRALDLTQPDDPEHDCIPPGSITGENRGARLVSLACEFHDLLNKILMVASSWWDSMSSERQRFLRLKLHVLQDEYRKVDPSSAFSMSDARSFFNEHNCWRFWDCPICDRRKFLETGSLLSHMCGKHPRVVLPRLQSVLDPKLTDEASLEADDSLDGVTFGEDSEQQDMICFNRSSGVFKWLFYSPSSGVGAKSFSETRERKRDKGMMLLESLKAKMKTLPADKSSAEFAEAVPKIEESWQNFLRASVVDYRAVILAHARAFLWRELKKCMTEDSEMAAKSITAADIDGVFSNLVDKSDSAAVEEQSSKPSDTKEDQETGDEQSSHTDGAQKVSEDGQESETHVEDESSETPSTNIELSDPPTSQAEGGNDLDTKLEKLEIDPKISEDNQQSELHVADESSETTVTDTELSDQPINIGSGNGLDAEVENLEADLETSENHKESDSQIEAQSSQATTTDTRQIIIGSMPVNLPREFVEPESPKVAAVPDTVEIIVGSMRVSLPRWW